MTIKDKLKSYNFWITLVSAIILLLQVFGEKFNFKIDSNFIIDVTTGLCSIFVVLGIISVPKAKTTKTDIRFVEPNYTELSEQISNQLMQKINNISLLEKVQNQDEKCLEEDNNNNNNSTIETVTESTVESNNEPEHEIEDLNQNDTKDETNNNNIQENMSENENQISGSLFDI